jgi:hypothetical protein
VRRRRDAAAASRGRGRRPARRVEALLQGRAEVRRAQAEDVAHGARPAVPLAVAVVTGAARDQAADRVPDDHDLRDGRGPGLVHFLQPPRQHAPVVGDVQAGCCSARRSACGRGRVAGGRRSLAAARRRATPRRRRSRRGGVRRSPGAAPPPAQPAPARRRRAAGPRRGGAGSWPAPVRCRWRPARRRRRRSRRRGKAAARRLRKHRGVLGGRPAKAEPAPRGRASSTLRTPPYSASATPSWMTRHRAWPP